MKLEERLEKLPGYLFIGIGVAHPQGLDPLPGAANSIGQMTSWAERQGYRTVCITDEANPVSAQLVKDKLAAVLEDNLDRIVVYFVGHGFLSYPDQIWIISDGPELNTGRVSRDTLRGSLATYHPRQISVISDACLTARYFPTGTVPVLMDRPGKSSRVFIDGFYSTLPNSLAFGANPAFGKPFCLFTSVLSDFLTGKDDRAFQVLTGKLPHVTTQTLLYGLPDAVLERGRALGVDQEPKIEPGFRLGDDIYSRFDRDGGPLPPSPVGPPLPEQPTSPTHPQTQTKPVRPDVSDKSIQPDVSEISDHHTLPDLPEKWKGGMSGFSALIFSSRESGLSDLTLNGKPAESFSKEMPLSDAKGAWLRVPFNELGKERSLMTLSWGTGPFSGYCMAPPYAGLVAMVRIAGGIESSPECAHLSWVPDYRVFDLNQLTRLAYWVIAQLTTGNLGSRNVRAIADSMRFEKHENPLLGIVCAYLYDLIGDTDSISRLCFFYKENHQAIPFDIALLSRGDLALTKTGWMLTYPAAKEDEQRKGPDVPDYLWRKTEEGTASVAGAAPFLRVGWSRLTPHTHPILRRFGQLQGALAPSPIATLVGDDARQIADALLHDLGIQ